MSKGTNKGTGRKPSPTERAYVLSWANYPFEELERLAYRAGYLAGWRAAKREGKR